MNEPSMDDKIQQLVTAVLEAVDARLDGIRHELAQFAADADARHHDVLDTVDALRRRVDDIAARPLPATSPAPADTARSVGDLNERMAQATKILVERMEAEQREASLATDRKVARLGEQLESLRTMVANIPSTPVATSAATPVSAPAATMSGTPAEVAPALTTAADTAGAAPAPAMSGSFGHVTGQLPHLNDDALAEISRPLFEHGHSTGPTPAVSDSDRVRQVTAPPIPPLVPTTMSPAGSPTGTPAAHAAHEDIDMARLTSLISDKLDHLSLPNRAD